MALLGFEGFDNIANQASGRASQTDMGYMPFGGGIPSNGVWIPSGLGILNKIPGLLGGFALQQVAALNSSLNCQLANNYATLIFGFRFKTSTTFLGNYIVCSINDSLTNQCNLSVNGVGRLVLTRGGTTLVTGTQQLVADSWYMIECQITINNATGAADIYVDGALEMSVSGVDTQSGANAWCNNVGLSFPSTTASSPGQAYDDFYICDTTGPAPYNAPLGVIRVETTFVGANVSVAWTPLSGTNYQMVDEQNMDLDTTYNSCSAAAIDLFTHGGLVNTPVTVFAVDVIACVRKTDVTNQGYRTKLVSGATTSNGHTMNPATVYQYVRDTYLTDPNTGLAWTAAGINATNVGYERL